MSEIAVMVTLDESVVARAAEQVVVGAFRAPQGYGERRGGHGYERVKEQVKKAIDALNLVDPVAAEIEKVIGPVITETVVNGVRAAVQKEVRALKASGELNRLILAGLREVGDAPRLG